MRRIGFTRFMGRFMAERGVKNAKHSERTNREQSGAL